GLIGFRESLRRVIDGTKALLLPTLFIIWLCTVSTDSAKLVPLGKIQALISLLTTITLTTTMAVLDSCPKHNMVAYLEKTEGNAEFHEIINFLTRSSIHHALTVSPVVSTTFVEQFWTSAKSKIINNVRYITAKVAGKSVSIFEASIRSDLLFDDANGIDSLPNQAIFDAIQLRERPSEAQPTPSPAPTSEVPHEPQTDSSPAHTSEVPLEQQTDPSPRPSPSPIIPDPIPETSGGNLGGHSSSDKSLSGNEGEMTLQSVYDLCLSLCAQVTDQAKEIQHLKAQIKKLKKQAKPVIHHHRAWLKSVSLKQRLTRKSFPKKQRVHKESVSKQGRKFAKGESSVQRDPLFDEIPEDTVDHMETENAQDEGRTRDIVDEDKEIEENVLSTEDVLSTDKDKVSTDKEKVSTDKQIVSTDRSKVSTDRHIKGTEEHIEGTEVQIESTDGQRKGIEDHTEGSATQATQTPTSTIFGDDETIAKVLLNMSQAKAISRSLLTLKPLPMIDQKTKGKKKIDRGQDEAARLLGENFQEQKREQFYNRRKEQSSFMTQLILKKIPCSTKIKSYQEQTTNQESIKKSNDDLTLKYKENDELRLHLTIAPDEEKEVDYEILDRKYPIKEWKTEFVWNH
ncbi:hypothetical protein Tco_0072217, partial [Tanacetum coccineum]